MIDFIKDVQNKGAGEIILTSIENEGLKNGLNLELYKMVEDYVNVPLIANGGVGSIKDITNFINHKQEISKKEIYNYCIKLKNEN